MDKPYPNSLLDTTVQDVLGKPLSRVDGPKKVSGTATYAAEYQFDNLAYGVLVSATIGKGKVLSIGVDAAKAMPGIIDVVIDFETFARVSQQGGETTRPRPGRPEDRPCRPDHRHRRRRELRSRPRCRQAARNRLRAWQRHVRLLGRSPARQAPSAQQHTGPVQPGRPRQGDERRCLHRRPDLQHPQPKLRRDGAPRLHRHLGRRRADALRRLPDADFRRAAARQGARLVRQEGPHHRPLHRWRLRLQARHRPRKRRRRDCRQATRPARQSRHDARPGLRDHPTPVQHRPAHASIGRQERQAVRHRP